MRTLLLTSAAVAALALGAGGAWAQGAGAPGAPSTTDEPGTLERPIERAPVGEPVERMPGGEPAPGVPPITSGSDTTSSGTSGAIVTPGSALAPSEGESFRDNETAFSGSVARGYNPDELLDQDVVTLEGEEVGEISDLLIGPDGRVTHAIVEAGGFLGIGEKHVVVDLETMRPNPDGALVTEMTQDEIEAQPRYEKAEGRWMQQAASNPAGDQQPGVGQPPAVEPSPGIQDRPDGTQPPADETAR